MNALVDVEVTAEQILETVNSSGIEFDDRIVGIYGELGAGAGISGGPSFFGIGGGEGVLFVGVDTMTGDVILTEYIGAVFGPQMVLGGPITGGAGVFGFNGSPEDMRGISYGGQANAIIGGGFGYSHSSGEIVHFYGANNTVGLVLQGGYAFSQSINGVTVYVAQPTELEQEWNLWHFGDIFDQIAVGEAFSRIGRCFLAGTQIDMWPEGLRAREDGTYDPAEVRAQSWKKPIEEITPDDWVVSFDKRGNLVPGRVTRTFRKDVAIVLDFWGTGVTPGHVFYRPDSKRPEKFETLIDILRDDGIVQNAQGQAIRAATGQPVGGPLDGFVWVVTGNRLGNGLAVIRDKRKLRLGTRLINRHGQDVCIGDLIADGGGMVTEEGWVRVGDAEMPFQWTFSDSLPNPEDYILARSGTSLEDIFKAAEWEAERPQMPPPMVRDGGPVQPLSEPARAAMPRNTPMAMRGGAAGGLNRKARRAAVAKARTKAKWLH